MSVSLATALPTVVLASVLLASTVTSAWAQTPEGVPDELDGVAVEEHLGDSVDPTLTFLDQDGNVVSIDDFLDGETPVLLTLNYYRCATLCSLQLNALLAGLQELEWSPGDEFRIVTVSIDPREGPELAKGKRDSYLAEYDRGDVQWDFLSGDSEAVAALADQVGVGFEYDPATDQFAHPAVLTFLSGDGTVSRYLYGLSYPARDLRFALIEASEGRVGSPVDKVILSCFRYDGTEGEYAPAALGFMRIAGALSVFGLGSLTLLLFRREKTWLSRSTR